MQDGFFIIISYCLHVPLTIVFYYYSIKQNMNGKGDIHDKSNRLAL